MSAFSTWLRAEMTKRNLDQHTLALQLATGDATVHGWLEQDVQPNLRSVVLLSRIFGVSTDTIIQLAGYDVVQSLSESERDARRVELLARLPRFAEIAEKITRLPVEKQDAYLSIIERLLPPTD